MSVGRLSEEDLRSRGRTTEKRGRSQPLRLGKAEMCRRAEPERAKTEVEQWAWSGNEPEH